MKQIPSSRKTNEIARERIAQILLTQVSDPRLAMVTVTGCEVAIDRSVCNVYISADRASYDEVKAGLEAAKGRIRYLLGKGLDWRVTPELRFMIDATVDEAERIAEALKVVPPTMQEGRSHEEG